MTAADRLRDMVAQATPGPWYRTPHSAHVNAADETGGWLDIASCEDNADAAFIALAPDLAALLADMAEEMQDYLDEFDVAEGRPPKYDLLRAVLARFDALLPEQPDEKT